MLASYEYFHLSSESAIGDAAREAVERLNIKKLRKKQQI